MTDITTKLVIAAVVVLLVIGLFYAYKWWAIQQQINDLAAKWKKDYGCSSSAAQKEAKCWVDALLKKFGFVKGLKYLKDPSSISTEDKLAFSKECKFACRNNPKPPPSS